MEEFSQSEADLLRAAAAAEAAPPALGSAPVPMEFRLLDHRIVKLWRLRHLLETFTLLGLGLIPGLLVGLQFAGGLRWVVWLGVAFILFRLWLLWWYPPRAYQAWGYRLDGQVLETRHGVWFRTLQLLPLPRLQHVDLRSGPVERHFGLASLVLHTAGTHQAAIIIPGLDIQEAERLREHLVAVGGDDGV